MRTKDLQADLFADSARRQPLPLDQKTLLSKPTYSAAFMYVLSLGNFEYEKQVYEDLGIDAGNWTRLKQGKLNLSFEQEKKFEELCGNSGLTIWRAFRAGKGVYDLQEAKDKRIADLERENAELKRDIETLQKYGVIRAAQNEGWGN